jgi:hypothetical protein
MTQQDITNKQYQEVLETCKDIFLKKTHDYGTSWRVLRTISIIDQIYIKAYRIRNIQNLKTQKVDDNIADEFKGIVNYAIVGLIQLELPDVGPEELELEKVTELYNAKANTAFELMQNKNHDYGEIWRSMSQEAITDLIITKVLRMKQIVQNDGNVLISEGLDANFLDILNYAMFALILIK